ncbi:helix-turn-helix domain-containing protein [Aestuariicoccus sp. MJ-SS9]|uniref:TetR/AcrR family transcriptional regulator n=1 Tax=Aestuariicoccus sp. MJ-SS9 TaxID=3079855 RepID=UPI00290F6309|nr:helix-turn-helix domain-containing protein [Aestuariicoccus sp. MJ-SS9]MDU8911098.1 helix-turn-helix domain-containing protein [Aestuariicoccus sp. MJ-SS9]
MADGQDIDDPKRAAILHAAFEVFLTYGVRRSSMEDIARKAGMSRPALYLHFRNKDDIFRALKTQYYDDAVRDVTVALSQDGPAEEVLRAAFLAQAGEVFEALMNSPHGDEILDQGVAMAGDVSAEGEARLAGVYADWLTRRAAAGRIKLPGAPEVLAEAMILALKGAKAPPYARYLERVSALAGLFGRGLEA